MAILQAADIADLIASAQSDLGRMRWTEIATGTQDHVAFNNLWRNKKVEFTGATAIQWNVMTQHSGAAAHVGLFGLDNVNVADVMQTATIPWRHSTTQRQSGRRKETRPASLLQQARR